MKPPVYSWQTLCSLVLLLVVASPVRADLRVIVGFDEQGPRVLKVVSASAALVKLGGQGGSRKRQATASVEIRWSDSAGRILTSERVADPRIAHYPGRVVASTDPQQPGGRVALQSGALLLRGPDDAHRLDIVLPATNVPLLAAENWTFYLDDVTDQIID